MATTGQSSNTVVFPLEKTAVAQKAVLADNSQAALRLQLTSLLQTTLELDQLLKLFFTEASHIVAIDSMNFDHSALQQPISFGQSSRHSCHYNLVTSKDSLGELAFTRRKQFAEAELKQLETLITSLICPLRNALLYREALQSAHRDPLTGVGNRLAMESTLERDIAIAKRNQQSLSLLVIDVDHFKAINDNYGHSAGDCVLKGVSRQLNLCCRESDASYHSYRFGGEEFVVLLNNTDSQGALIAAERLRHSIETMSTNYDGHSIQVTASIGISTLVASDTSASLFDRADKALYQAKQNGRNQTLCDVKLENDGEDGEVLAL